MKKRPYSKKAGKEGYNLPKLLKDYGLGSYVQNPSERLAENSIDLAGARHRSETNPLVIGLGTLGNAAMAYGTSQLAGDDKLGRAVGSALPVLGNLGFATGGVVPVNIEGKETGELPDGRLFKAVGPNHENSGIDIKLPSGTEIFSDRISVDGKTMSERKQEREKRLSRIKKRLDKNPTDTLLKNALLRTKQITESQETDDMFIQQSIRQGDDREKAEYATGGTIPPEDELIKRNLLKMMGEFPYAKINPVNIQLPEPALKGSTMYIDPVETVVPEPVLKTVGSVTVPVKTPAGTDSAGSGEGLSGHIFNDSLGAAGNLVSAFGPLFSTLAQRAGDTPNTNEYRNYGKDGLETMGSLRPLLQEMMAMRERDIDSQTSTALRSARNSARGANSLRASEALLTRNSMDVKNKLTETNANTLMSLLSQEAQMENQRDQAVMGGEQQRDLADRQDRDAYYTNLARNIVGMGSGIQSLARNLNESASNRSAMDMFSEMETSGTNTAENEALRERLLMMSVQGMSPAERVQFFRMLQSQG